MYSRPNWHSSEPTARDPTNKPTQQKQKPPNARPQSSSWGWPRFVSVEVDVEESRRQRSETMPVNATAELSRPDQGARNESFQRAHDRFSHSSPTSESSRQPDNVDTFRRADTVTAAAPAEDRHQPMPQTSMDVKAQTPTTKQVDDGTQHREKDDASQAVPPLGEFPEDFEKKEDVARGRTATREEAQVLEGTSTSETAGSQHPGRSRNPSTPGTFPRDDTESVYSQSSADHKDIQLPSSETKRKLSYEAPADRAPTIRSQQKSRKPSVNEAPSGPIPDSNFTDSPEHLDNTGSPPQQESDSRASGKAKRESDFPGSVESSAMGYTEAGVRLRRYSPPTQYGRRGSSVDRIEQILPESEGGPPANPPIGDEEDLFIQPGSIKVSGPGPRAVGSRQVSGNGKIEGIPENTGSLSSRLAAEVEAARSGKPTSEGLPSQAPGDFDQDLGPSATQPITIDENSERTEQYKRTIDEDVAQGKNAEQDARSVSDKARKSIPGQAGIDRQASFPTSIMGRKSSKATKKVTLPPPPKIFVQSPSEVTQDEPADPHPTPSEPLHNDGQRIISRNGSVVSVSRTVQSASDRLGPRPVRKRKLYVRKARNLAARPIFLNAVLGRKVGRQTKDRLRRLARGEEVPALPVSTKPRASDAALLKKQGSFVRKARNVVARPSLMNLAFGKKVAGETKPALRYMAAGDSVVFGESEDYEAEVE